MDVPVTILIPSYDEQDNVDPMVERLDRVFAGSGLRPEVLYVDDSRDDTPGRVLRAAGRARSLDVRLLHRDRPDGGLAGAVVTGMRAARGGIVVVMDGDLQHPPEAVPRVLQAFADPRVEVVVASRHVAGGSSGGLDGRWRSLASAAGILVARSLFPSRLARCTDPMTGFFAVRADRLDLDRLRPRGFKILLEVLASHSLWVEQVPLAFAPRGAGESKASLRVGVSYLRQLLSLRVRNRALRFAAVGAAGTVANLALTAALMALGVHYLPAGLAAAEATILGNFLVQEVFVFGDLRGPGGRAGSAAWWRRLATWGLFNNAELLVRTPVLVSVVEVLRVPVLPAQAALLGIAFAVRFAFTRFVVYRRGGRGR